MWPQNGPGGLCLLLWKAIQCVAECRKPAREPWAWTRVVTGMILLPAPFPTLGGIWRHSCRYNWGVGVLHSQHLVGGCRTPHCLDSP